MEYSKFTSVPRSNYRKRRDKQERRDKSDVQKHKVGGKAIVLWP